jgi:seryl-tRNA synthetase
MTAAKLVVVSAVVSTFALRPLSSFAQPFAEKTMKTTHSVGETMPQGQLIAQQDSTKVKTRAQDLIKEINANKKKAKALVQQAEKVLNTRSNGPYDTVRMKKGEDLYNQAITLDPTRKDELTKKMSKKYLQEGAIWAKGYCVGGYLSKTSDAIDCAITYFNKAVDLLSSSKKDVHDLLVKFGNQARDTNARKVDDWIHEPADAKLYYAAAKRYE